jgi:hypothetical protein
VCQLRGLGRSAERVVVVLIGFGLRPEQSYSEPRGRSSGAQTIYTIDRFLLLLLVLVGLCLITTK